MTKIPSSTWLGLPALFLALLLVALPFTDSFGPRQTSANSALASESSQEHVKASLIADCKEIVAGSKFKLGVELVMADGWHTYYKESGEAGMPTRITWALPEGFKASGDLVWERPEKLVDAGIVTYGYNGKTVIAQEIQAPEKLSPAGKVSFKAALKWLACKDACIPGSAQIELNLPVSASGKAVPDNAEKFKKVNFNGPASEISSAGESQSPLGNEKKKPDSGLDKGGKAENGKELLQDLKVQGLDKPEAGIWAYLLFAFIGGFILNFMPCVLPVISIKIFSLVEQAGEDPKKVLLHGLTFASGIILSFLALAGLVVAVQGAGQKIGWGFQFQYPIFVFLMACIVTLFALSMFGVFYINVSAGQQKIDELASSEGLSGTFFKGVLATLLSTPCTAPFLGSALGFAFAQPWWLVLSFFLVIGLGMSSPYLILAVRPDWMKFLPRPGDWMVKFKESLGFLLLATSIWLLSVLTGLVEPDAVIAALSFLAVLSGASWLLGGFITLSSSNKQKGLIWSLAALTVFAGYWLFLRPFPELLGTSATAGLRQPEKADESGIVWQDFSPAKLESELKAGHTVFIDFTAKWCLTCKANEATIINTAGVAAKFKELRVVPLKADWTAQDPEISELLRKFGRSGVPVYVVFPAKSPDRPIVLPEALTLDAVLAALTEAGPSLASQDSGSSSK